MGVGGSNPLAPTRKSLGNCGFWGFFSFGFAAAEALVEEEQEGTAPEEIDVILAKSAVSGVGEKKLLVETGAEHTVCQITYHSCVYEKR